MVHLWFHLIPKKQITVNHTVIFIIEFSSFLLPVIKEGCNTHTHTHTFPCALSIDQTHWSEVLPLSKVKCPHAMGIFLTLCSARLAYFSFCWLHDLFDPVILVQVSMLSSDLQLFKILGLFLSCKQNPFSSKLYASREINVRRNK